jgi:hypothetical protein
MSTFTIYINIYIIYVVFFIVIVFSFIVIRVRPLSKCTNKSATTVFLGQNSQTGRRTHFFLDGKASRANYNSPYMHRVGVHCIL